MGEPLITLSGSQLSHKTIVDGKPKHNRTDLSVHQFCSVAHLLAWFKGILTDTLNPTKNTIPHTYTVTDINTVINDTERIGDVPTT